MIEMKIPSLCGHWREGTELESESALRHPDEFMDALFGGRKFIPVKWVSECRFGTGIGGTR